MLGEVTEWPIASGLGDILRWVGKINYRFCYMVVEVNATAIHIAKCDVLLWLSVGANVPFI